MHADDPVDEDGPDVLVDIALVAHVRAVRLREDLRHLHVLLDVLAVQTHVINIADRGLVDFGDL